jgi:dihydropteroate synthase
VVSTAPVLFCRDKRLSLETPRVMGVLNVTPDSFSDGGRFSRNGHIDPAIALAAAQQMIDDGAAIIDVGGESTRPGSSPVDPQEELRRVIPIVERLAAMATIVSVDTSKAVVARAALEAGAHIINDVCALEDPEMLAVVAGSDAGVCLMHKRGEPRTMQEAPYYADVADEVSGYLKDRVKRCAGAGIAHQRIAIDPGFGFGKSLEHNLTLLRRLGEIAAIGCPVLVGLSRKGMIGTITGRSAGARVAGSIAAAVIAVQRGARIVRAHDVAATVDALKVTARIMEI